MRRLAVIDLGRRDYRSTLGLQRTLREEVLAGTRPNDLLLLVEHDPVYTLGRTTRPSSLPTDPAFLRQRGADVVEIERGGDVTWHGPGQLVGYPILDLTRHREDLHWYLRALETLLIGALAEGGLEGHTIPGKTGVWVGPRKIASLGVHVRRWVTLHGFALNVDPDLSWFDAIVPCGIAGVEMTSIARERGRAGPPGALDRFARESVLRRVVATFAFDEVVTLPLGAIVPGETPAEPCESAPARPPFMPYG